MDRRGVVRAQLKTEQAAKLRSFCAATGLTTTQVIRALIEAAELRTYILPHSTIVQPDSALAETTVGAAAPTHE